MKRLFIFLSFVFGSSLVSCGNNQLTLSSIDGSADSLDENSSNISSDKDVNQGNQDSLVVYFSWSTSGNTMKMANYIKDSIETDIIRLIPANPYPTDYNQTGEAAKIERDENARPEISNLPDTIGNYSNVFVGYPIWWHTAPMIIGTFLNSYDFSNINIYPFSQSASMDAEQFNNSMEFIKENALNGIVHDGLFVRSSDTNGIESYLKVNGFMD